MLFLTICDTHQLCTLQIHKHAIWQRENSSILCKLLSWEISEDSSRRRPNPAVQQKWGCLRWALTTGPASSKSDHTFTSEHMHTNPCLYHIADQKIQHKPTHVILRRRQIAPVASTYFSLLLGRETCWGEHIHIYMYTCKHWQILSTQAWQF